MIKDIKENINEIFPLYESHNMRLKYVSFKRCIHVFHIKVDSKALNHHAQKQLTNTSILSKKISTIEILFLSEAFGYAVSAY